MQRQRNLNANEDMYTWFSWVLSSATSQIQYNKNDQTQNQNAQRNYRPHHGTRRGTTKDQKELYRCTNELFSRWSEHQEFPVGSKPLGENGAGREDKLNNSNFRSVQQPFFSRGPNKKCSAQLCIVRGQRQARSKVRWSENLSVEKTSVT